jgi:glycosyltransferase involved in cell wall biosynthesis
MRSVAVVMPALDEEDTVGSLVREVSSGAVRWTIVVDNGSRDRTAERAREAGATVVHEPRRGYGSACLAGLAAARARGADTVVLMDADGSDPVERLPDLLAGLDHGADLVLGYRDPAAIEPGAMTLAQRAGNRFAVLLMRAVVGARYRDLPPFKAITADALERLGLSDTGYGFTIQLLLRAHEERLAVTEVPVACRRRRGGQSKVSGTVRGTLGAGVKIVSAIARHAFPRTRR